MSKIKQKVIAHLDKLEADILLDIDNKYKYCTDTVSRSKDYIKYCAISLSIWKNDLKSLKQHTSEIHIFQTVKSLDSKTHQKELEIRKIQTTTVPILAYHPSESESNMNKILPDLGTITVDTVLVPMPMLDIFQQGQFSVNDKRKLSLTTKLGNEVNIYRCCFIPGNRLLLCQDGDRQLYVCQLDGSEFEIVNLDYTPECITLYDNYQAVVSSGFDGIQIIDLKTLKPGGIIRIEGNCDGITTVKDKILVQNKPNTIVDIKGKVQNTIMTTFHPCKIFANKDGDMYCTDFDSDKVYVVTSDGQEPIIGLLIEKSCVRNRRPYTSAETPIDTKLIIQRCLRALKGKSYCL
ncbi:Hypothetical predicted protein [Mytilus galloprovincialis]|uniref:Uncharacterized protein n=1 Tax=Mytilus galloprovincialis TaxID=29158 RepID=A0A8B6D1C2_MYTGA|nr:Hypothetical predicted protein [Mytilus galloprovincialis]